MRNPLRRPRLRRTPLLLAAAALTVGLVQPAPQASAGNPPTPGGFTGLGFEQCETQSQQKMTTWWYASPYQVVGVYISGNSRGCRNQPNLTPSWVTNMQKLGWRLLPITLGPQASCSSRYPRYGRNIDPTISPSSANGYAAARSQGRKEAANAVSVAKRLGISARSTLWYDLEGFDTSGTACRESAKWFLSAWTNQLHDLGYRSGVYSSAGSGMKMLDDARVQTPGRFKLPDDIWIADWNGKADTSSSYIRKDGWQPHRRVHQFRGGHNETYGPPGGRVTINMDSDWVDLGGGSNPGREPRHCGLPTVNLAGYPRIAPGSTDKTAVQVLQCHLTEQKLYTGPVNGRYNQATIDAARTYQRRHGLPVGDTWVRKHWVSLVSVGAAPVVKLGSAGPAVRRAQRALGAALGRKVPVTGYFGWGFMDTVKEYQGRIGFNKYGVVTPMTWKALGNGRF